MFNLRGETVQFVTVRVFNGSGIFNSAYAELLALVVRHQEDLLSRLNDEEKEIFEKFSECSTEMHDLTQRESFVKGFTLGAKIIIEVMTTGDDE